MFEEDPRVLYVSLHRFDIFPFKPEESDCNVVGSGAGAGFTVNVAWPKVLIIKNSFDLIVFQLLTFCFIVIERNG
jgi:acetoin utilization deacetylase AcuC-like enzyme